MKRTIKVAVFGGGHFSPESKEYRDAVRVGRYLADKDIMVATGAYSGIMEAAIKGAKEKNGKTIGYTNGNWDTRTPNSYFEEDEIVDCSFDKKGYKLSFEETYGKRMMNLLSSNGFVILPGRAGTLTELYLVVDWNTKKWFWKNKKPVVFLGSKNYFDLIIKQISVFIENPNWLFHTTDPEEAVKFILEKISKE